MHAAASSLVPLHADALFFLTRYPSAKPAPARPGNQFSDLLDAWHVIRGIGLQTTAPAAPAHYQPLFAAEGSPGVCSCSFVLFCNAVLAAAAIRRPTSA